MVCRDTKKVIINTAEIIISDKGFEKTTISEICKKVGIADSVVYHYFKGKEDLLFSIAEERLRDMVQELYDHLEGIIDPLSMLRKLIWFHLNYIDKNPQFIYILMLECLRNKNFYVHNAYGMIRKYSSIIIDVLKEGINKEVFRDDFNLRVVRDMILGLLDMEALNSLATDEITKCASDLDDIMKITLPMIVVKSESNSVERDKSYRILKAAQKVFAEKGYDEATIAEIAKSAKVAEGTIYEYFQSKEDLLFSITEKNISPLINSLDKLFLVKSPLMKLHSFITLHFLNYLSKRNFYKIFLTYVLYNQRFWDSHKYDFFRHYAGVLYPLLEEGTKEGVFRSDINSRLYRNLLLGAFSHISNRWIFFEENNKVDNMQEMDEAVQLLSLAVIANPKILEAES